MEQPPAKPVASTKALKLQKPTPKAPAKAGPPKGAETKAETKSEVAPAPAAKTAGEVTWRKDFKCGPLHPNAYHEEATCDPGSEYPCCAPSGWCGVSQEHCQCMGCMDYRPIAPVADKGGPKSIVIIIPFRDRGIHYQKWSKAVSAFIPEHPGNHKFTVLMIEQFDEELFNRGWLFNVGLRMAMQEPELRPDCLVTHDVDNVPMQGVTFNNCQYPTQISSEIQCWGWNVPYANNVGGVVSASPEHWKRINGFSSNYQGWGGEDDDLYFRFKH